MTAITTSSTIGIVLSSPSYTNPVVVNPGVTISDRRAGVLADSGSWTIQNSGEISGSGTYGFAMELLGGGLVKNAATGTIDSSQYRGIYIGGATGTVLNAGSIFSGGGEAVEFSDGGYVSNAEAGTIIGLAHAGVRVKGAAGTMVNAGLIVGGGVNAAVQLYAGGFITNLSSGTVSHTSGGGDFFIGGGAGTVVNAGTLVTDTTKPSVGVNLSAGGSVTNQVGATISTYLGIIAYSAAVTIVNAGRIVGNATASFGGGILLLDGGSITNQSGATITGHDGIYGDGGSLYNSSTGTTNYSNGAGVFLSNAGSIAASNIDGVGVLLGTGGGISNQYGGTISGYRGIVGGITAATTIVNAGTIGGIGTAVSFGAGLANRLVVDPGAVFDGEVDGGNMIGAAAVTTLELASGASAGTLSGLGSKYVDFGSIAFDSGASWTIAGNTAGLGGVISGFAQGDTIDLAGLNDMVQDYTGTTLTLVGDQTVTLNLPGAFTAASFQTAPDAGTGTNVFLACFVRGTRIATEHGDIAVETLRVDDHVCLARTGGVAPIVWVGHRTVDCSRHPKPATVWPICILAGAFGSGLPLCDLWLSPDHALYIDGVLLPTKHLINGTTVKQVRVSEVTYYHVELPHHDLLLAEGLPCESYLDTGDRGRFADGGGQSTLHPDFTSRVWESDGCALLIVTGPRLDAVRRWLSFVASTNGVRAAA